MGVLKGADPICNLVLDEAIEFLRGKMSMVILSIDAKDPYKLSGSQRNLGVLVARGPQVLSISDEDGFNEIANPYAAEGG